MRIAYTKSNMYAALYLPKYKKKSTHHIKNDANSGRRIPPQEQTDFDAKKINYKTYTSSRNKLEKKFAYLRLSTVE